MKVPNTNITDIPLNSDIRAEDLAVFSLGLSRGSFRIVYKAFNLKSGELQVVKVIKVKSKTAGKLLQLETEMVTQYPHAQGLIH